jgi:hypothetical protein
MLISVMACQDQCHLLLSNKLVQAIVCCIYEDMSKDDDSKAVPLQVWSGPEGSRKLRFPNFLTVVQDGDKVVSLMHRPH